MLENTNVKEQFTIGTSATFDFGVRFFSPGDVSVYEYDPNTKVETELTSGTDYSIEELTDYSSGAKVTLLGPLTSGNILTIVRTALPVQDVALPNFGKIPSESLETQMDRMVATVQQITDTVKLAMRMPYGASGTQTPEEYMSDFVSSNGGGGGGGSSGGSVTFASSAGMLVESGASALVDSAMTRISSGGTAYYAKNAEYHGPFAVTHVSGDMYDVAGGRVFAGGTAYDIDGAENVQADSAYLYLVLTSSGGSLSSSFPESEPSPITSNMLVTRLAACEGAKVTQYQFGDITCVPWGGGSGGGGGSGDNLHDKKAYLYEQPESPGIIYAEPNTQYHVAFMQDLKSSGSDVNIYDYYITSSGGSMVMSKTDFTDLEPYSAGFGCGAEIRLPTPTSACSISITLAAYSSVVVSVGDGVKLIDEQGGEAINLWQLTDGRRKTFSFVMKNGQKYWYASGW